MTGQNPSHESNGVLQKKMEKIASQLHLELKRLGISPAESSGNTELYNQFVTQILEVKEETSHPDYIISLSTAADRLKKAAEQAKNKAPNKDILIHLQAANAEMCKCKNITS